MGLERKLCSGESRCRDEFQAQECRRGWGQKVRICQGSLATWSRKLDQQRTRALMSLAVLRTNDRTSVKGSTTRSGDRSGIRDMTARFNQFGCPKSEEWKVLGTGIEKENPGVLSTVL